jgi:hypothetical protein
MCMLVRKVWPYVHHCKSNTCESDDISCPFAILIGTEGAEDITHLDLSDKSASDKGVSTAWIDEQYHHLVPNQSM